MILVTIVSIVTAFSTLPYITLKFNKMQTGKKTKSIRVDADPILHDLLENMQASIKTRTGKITSLGNIMHEICLKSLMNIDFDQNSDQNLMEGNEEPITNTGFLSKEGKKLLKLDNELKKAGTVLKEKEKKLIERERSMQDQINDFLDQKSAFINMKQVLFERGRDNYDKLLKLADAEKALIEKDKIITDLNDELEEAYNLSDSQQNDINNTKHGIDGILQSVNTYLPAIDTVLLAYIASIINNNGQTLGADNNTSKIDLKSIITEIIDQVSQSKGKSVEEIIIEIIKRFTSPGKDAPPQS